MLNRDARARKQAPPRATLRRSLGLRGGNCAAEAGFDDEGGGRLAVDGRGRDGITFPEQQFLFFRPAPQAAWSILFFLGRGRGGTDWN